MLTPNNAAYGAVTDIILLDVQRRAQQERKTTVYSKRKDWDSRSFVESAASESISDEFL